MAVPQRKTSLRVVGEEIVAVDRISDEETERLVASIYYSLGAAAIDKFSSIVTPNYFTVPMYRTAYAAMLKMRKDGLDIDDSTFQHYMKTESPNYGEAYYEDFVFSLDAQVKASNLERYVEALAGRFKARKLQSVMLEAWSSLNASMLTPDALISSLRKSLDDCDSAGVFSAGTAVGELIDSRVQRLESLKDSLSDYTGIASGCPQLDAMTQGWQPADLIVIAGATSMGKTALTLSSVWESVKMYPEKFFFFSTQEMATGQIIDRLISIETGINLLKMRSPRHLKEEDFKKIKLATERIKDSRLILEDSVLPPDGVVSQWLRAMSKYGDNIGLFVLDYLQYSSLCDSERYGNDERIAISNGTRALKEFAKKSNVPVIALSQITRAAVDRCIADHRARPHKGDMDGSATIEKTADVIVITHRPVVYFPAPPETAEGRRPATGGATYRNAAEVIIAKQRNGPIGTLNFTFNAENARFSDPLAAKLKTANDHYREA